MFYAFLNLHFSNTTLAVYKHPYPTPKGSLFWCSSVLPLSTMCVCVGGGIAEPKLLNYQAHIEHLPLPIFPAVTDATSCSSEGELSLTSYTEFLTLSDRSLTCDSGENHALNIIPGHSPPCPHVHTISPELPESSLLQSIMCI